MMWIFDHKEDSVKRNILAFMDKDTLKTNDTVSLSVSGRGR